MRTKLFLAFIFIIFLALFSNIIFERLIIDDFNDFIQGTQEDQIYWIMASVEGSFRDGTWDMGLMAETLHWSMMLGFETYVENMAGEKVLSSSDVIATMNPHMINRMSSVFNLSSNIGDYTWYPLYVEGEEVGKIYIRPVEKLGEVALKEEIFRKRGRQFLIISFFIAGGGALVLSVLFTKFLSDPVKRLTRSADKIARGDFSIHEKATQRRFRDEIDKLTETFNYMSEALRREDELRKHLTSNIAHELRTPLTIIKGNLEAIDDGIISDPRAALDNIRSEMERIIALVEGIEDVTSAEASFFKKGSLEEINLKEFVEPIAAGMRKMMGEKGLYLHTEGPSLQVSTYPDKLHIILKNLLTNAYKFTDRGGISVSWNERRADGHRGFSLTVEDTGRGITESELSQIFERFYKGKSSSGKGLGLAIVKELTEVIGGKIEVKSTAHQGSSFTVLL